MIYDGLFNRRGVHYSLQGMHVAVSCYPFRMGLAGRWLAICMTLCNLWLVHPASLPAMVRRDAEKSQSLVPITTIPQRTLLQTDQAVCPLDFSILNKYTWIKEACGPTKNTTSCCLAALSEPTFGTTTSARCVWRTWRPCLFC